MTVYFTKKQKLKMAQRKRRKKMAIKAAEAKKGAEAHHQKDDTSASYSLKGDAATQATAEKEVNRIVESDSAGDGDSKQQDETKKKIDDETRITTTNIKKITGGGNDDGTTAKTTTRKRQREEKYEEDTNNTVEATTMATKLKMGTVVVIPANVTGKKARKFRKDARRKARANGKDDSVLEFVIEGKQQQHSEQQEDIKHDENNHSNNDNSVEMTNGEDDTTNNNKQSAKTDNKNFKRVFPRINEILQEQEKLKQKQESEKQRLQEEEELPLLIKKRYVALDCEMVGIGSEGKKSALARVSMTDWFGETMLDTYVQVPSRVTDFRTHVSGILPKHIDKYTNPEAMPVDVARKTVAKLLEGKILVGHALKNDLHALLLQHPKGDIRDTAHYRPFQRLGKTSRQKAKWKPRKLRDLVFEHCNLTIQEKGKSHDSVLDASATMQLFKSVRKEWEQSILQKKAKK